MAVAGAYQSLDDVNQSHDEEEALIPMVAGPTCSRTPFAWQSDRKKLLQHIWDETV